MDYGLIGKLEKAKRYAEDTTRFRSTSLVTVHGDNNIIMSNMTKGVSNVMRILITTSDCGPYHALEILLKGNDRGSGVQG